MNYKHITLAFIFTAIFLAALFGVYTYQQQKINAPSTQITEEESTLSTWHTYINKKFGYEFKYPTQTRIAEQGSTNGTCVRLTFGLAHVSFQTDGTICTESGRGASDKDLPIEKDKITLNDIKYTAESYLIDSSADEFATQPFNNFYRLNNVFGTDTVIEYGGRYASSEKSQFTTDLEMVRQILSTFKFTNPVPTGDSTTSSWQTFSSDVAKFSFQYPATWSLKESSPIKLNTDEVNGQLSLTGPEGSATITLGTGFGGGTCDVWGGKLQNIKVGNQIQKTCLLVQNNQENYNSTCADCGDLKNSTIDYNVKYTVNTPVDTNRSTLTKILSTFKFTKINADLKSQIENWTAYTQASTHLSWDNCSAEPAASSSLKGLMSAYPVFTRVFNGTKLAYSSKLDFTPQEVSQFTLCEAGNYYPIYTFSDKILWVQPCSTGMADKGTQECEETLAQVKNIYGYQDR